MSANTATMTPEEIRLRGLEALEPPAWPVRTDSFLAAVWNRPGRLLQGAPYLALRLHGRRAPRRAETTSLRMVDASAETLTPGQNQWIVRDSAPGDRSRSCDCARMTELSMLWWATEKQRAISRTSHFPTCIEKNPTWSNNMARRPGSTSQDLSFSKGQ